MYGKYLNFCTDSLATDFSILYLKCVNKYFLLLKYESFLRMDAMHIHFTSSTALNIKL